MDASRAGLVEPNRLSRGWPFPDLQCCAYGPLTMKHSVFVKRFNVFSEGRFVEGIPTLRPTGSMPASAQNARCSELTILARIQTVRR